LPLPHNRRKTVSNNVFRAMHCTILFCFNDDSAGIPIVVTT